MKKFNQARVNGGSNYDSLKGDSLTCGYCQRSFQSSIGLGVHKNSAHPEEYNAETQAKFRPIKVRWTLDDEKLLAWEEVRLARLKVKHINQALWAKFPDRTVEAIKGHRKSDAYRALVSQLGQRSEPCSRLGWDSDPYPPLPHGNQVACNTGGSQAGGGRCSPNTVQHLTARRTTRMGSPDELSTPLSPVQSPLQSLGNPLLGTPLGRKLSGRMTLNDAPSCSLQSLRSGVSPNLLGRKHGGHHLGNIAGNSGRQGAGAVDTLQSSGKVRANPHGRMSSVPSPSRSALLSPDLSPSAGIYFAFPGEGVAALRDGPEVADTDVSALPMHSVGDGQGSPDADPLGSGSGVASQDGEVGHPQNLSPHQQVLWDEVERLLPISALACCLQDKGSLDLQLVWEAVKTQLSTLGRVSNITPARRVPAKRPTKPWRRRVTRRVLSRRYQQLYRSNKSRLLEEITSSGDDGAPVVHPSAVDIQETFGNLFSSPSPEDPDEPDGGCCRPCDGSVVQPITQLELTATLKRMRASAPGPDGILLHQLVDVDANSMLILYNLMLLYGDTPSDLRKSKTVLIPKKGDLSKATNWRPLTISSLVIRVFHSMLAARLSKAFPFHPGQRAFRPLDGVSTAVACLSSLIADRRKVRKSLCVISLDVSKAFDSVSHHSITRRLRAMNVHPLLVKYLGDSYVEASTSIKCGPHLVEGISVNRGVKQGDPLSPFLFNSILDELLRSIPEGMGVTCGGHSLPIIAYADDLILYTNTAKMMSELLRRVTEFFSKRGLSLNVSKCASLSLIPCGGLKKMVHGSVPTFRIGDELIPCVTSQKLLTYLGCEFSTKGQRTPSLTSCYLAIRKVVGSPLRPHQKVDLIKNSIIPEMVFRLSLSKVAKCTLRRHDVFIRQQLKQILHLPHYTNDAFFHAPCKDSGLGVAALLYAVPLQAMSKVGKLLQDPHPAVRCIGGMTHITKVVSHYTKMIYPLSATRAAVQHHWREEWRRTFAGNGTSELAKHRLSTRWICENTRFGNQYVDKVKLVSNTFLTRTSIPKATRQGAHCRGGCGKLETMSHISQQCPLGYAQRIVRHNKLVAIVGRLAEDAGHEVLYEPHFLTSEGLRKPDLVVHPKDNPAILVVDVTVPWECPMSLAGHARKKVEYYGTPAMLAYLKERWPTKSVTFHGFVVSARGGWFGGNSKLLDVLGVSVEKAAYLCPLTMEQTIRVYRYYMKSSQM